VKELWSGTYTGRLPGVNEWHKVSRGRIYEGPEYRKAKEDMAVGFGLRRDPVIGPVDLLVDVSLWKMRDTDGPIKAIMDALELAGLIENDRQIRNIVINRTYHKKAEPDTLRVVLFEVGGLDE
jgi:Holliday junction resolvase RusA-like endonuclease